MVQLSGVFYSLILGIFLLGFFFPRVQKRSAIVAFLLTAILQTTMLAGSMFLLSPSNSRGRRLETSIAGCSPYLNVSLSSISTSTSSENSNIFLSLFSTSPLWFVFNGSVFTILCGIVFSFILDDRKDVDPSLLVSWKDLFLSNSTTKKTEIEDSTKKSHEEVETMI